MLRFTAILSASVVLAACGSSSKATEGSGAGASGGDSGTGGSIGGGSGQASGGQAGGAQGGAGGEPPRYVITVHGLAYGNGSFVATASEYVHLHPSEARGVIFQSLDGSTWERVQTNLPLVPNAIAYGNDRFVSLGSHFDDVSRTSTAVAYVSSDGVEWTTADLPATSAGALAFGDGYFLAGSELGYLRSEDGTTWENVGSQGKVGTTLAFAAGRFASRQVFETPKAWVGDGEEFTEVDVTGDPAYPVTFLRAVNDAFVGVSQVVITVETPTPMYRSMQFASDDGLSWTRSVSLLTMALDIFADDGSLCAGLVLGKVQTGPTCDQMTASYSPSFFPLAVLAAEGKLFVGGGPTFSESLVASDDGSTWLPMLWPGHDP